LLYKYTNLLLGQALV